MDSFWDFFWLLLSCFLLVAYLVLLFQILGDLFRDRSTNGFVKALWVLALIVLPWLTALIYLLVRGDGMANRQREAVQEAQANAESYIRSVAGAAPRSPADEIAQAAALRDAGTITAEEFEAIKAEALSAARRGAQTG